MKTSLRFALPALRRVTHLSVNPDPIDAWLSKWGSVAGGLILVTLTIAGLTSHSSNGNEMLLGIGVALIACANLFLFGFLSRRVHLAWDQGVVLWRGRTVELGGLGIGFGIIGVGSWCIPRLDLGPMGILIGGLLALSLAIAIMCLGLWSTLSKTA
jgi:hypothetical protein